VQEGERVLVAIFPALGEPTAPVEPSDGSVDDPTVGFNHEPLGLFCASDDLHRRPVYGRGDAGIEDWFSIGTVGEQLTKERELSKQCGHQQDAAIAVLNSGGGHQRVRHQAQCIDQDIPLLAGDQLAGIEAMRVNAGAPFSALFTLSRSITQAVGLTSRSTCSRHFT
jgi:hypothetical protein